MRLGTAIQVEQDLAFTRRAATAAAGLPAAERPSHRRRGARERAGKRGGRRQGHLRDRAADDPAEVGAHPVGERRRAGPPPAGPPRARRAEAVRAVPGRVARCTASSSARHRPYGRALPGGLSQALLSRRRPRRDLLSVRDTALSRVAVWARLPPATGAGAARRRLRHTSRAE